MIILKLLYIIGAYFIGSIPVGYLLVKHLKGVDIRSVGSGNIGATNVGRILGKKGFVLVLILDALKGFVPVFLFGKLFASPLIIFVALAVILGHTFSIFLNFKGGKGVATGLGVFLALAPTPTIIAVLIFIVIVYFTKMISVGSIVAAVALAILVSILFDVISLIVFTWIAAIFIIYMHRANISRVLNGTENKIKL